MKWRPRSLAGQLLALLLLAVVAAHLIAVLMQQYWSADAQVHPLSWRKTEMRVASAYRVAVGHPSMSDSMLEAISLPESRFLLSGTPFATDQPMDPQEAGLANKLRTRLSLPPDAPVMVRLLQVSLADLQDVDGTPDWLVTALEAAPAWALDIAVGLPNGKWLRSQHWPAMMHGHWSRVLNFSLPVSVVPITLIAVFFGWRIMRPLKALSNAARRVSRGEKIAPLPLEGPDGVREITVAFNDMQERLIRYVEDRTRMIADMGHDLRTPLTSLRIRAELIEDAPLRDAMILTLDEMSVMVEETLRFARNDSAREPTSDVDIVALASEVVDEQRSLGQQVMWSPPPAIPYRCRPVSLKRALRNLIDNAARYGQVWVRVMADDAESGLRIEVEDDGPGIDPDLIEQAFRPFARLDLARSPQAGGAGLGLTIARSCIRAHGGELTLHNRRQGGLRAVIVLPS